MITMRYHAVTIVSVFLALTLGIFIGSASVSGSLVDRLERDVDRARAAREEAQTEASEVATELGALRARLNEQIAPWAVSGLLAGRDIVIVTGPEPVSWGAHIRDSMLRASAVSVGGITLAGGWDNADPNVLADTVRQVVPSFEASEDVVSDVLSLIAANLTTPAGRDLLTRFSAAGLLTLTPPAGATNWPNINSGVIVLGVGAPPEAISWTESFALGSASANPTLVVSDTAESASALTRIRTANVASPRLSTFDAADPEIDPSGVGTVAALLAAFQERGGHFGTADGRRFVPEP